MSFFDIGMGLGTVVSSPPIGSEVHEGPNIIPWVKGVWSHHNSSGSSLGFESKCSRPLFRGKVYVGEGAYRTWR